MPQQIEITVMAPNHGGDPLGSILGPMGSHWIQKMGQNRKKLPCPKIRIFGFPAVIDFSQKIKVTVKAPNHGGDPLGSFFGRMGSHWVKKMGSNGKKLPCPKIRIFGGHRFFAKNRSYGYGAKSRWGTPRVHLGANGVPLGKTMGQNRKKLPCPKIRIFGYPVVILGPMGSHWVQKTGQNRKNYHAPKFKFFATPRSSFLSQKIEITVMAPNHGGDPLGFILGPMGSHWVEKMGQNRKKLPCPKIRIFGYPTVIDLSQKMEVTVMAPNHDGDP